MHAASSPARTAASLFAAALVAVLLACGKTAAGETCVHDSDCESGACALIGRCAPGECECSGAECGTTQSSCDDGQVCVAGQPPFELGYNRCRVTCSVDRPCANAKVCTNGLCGTATIDALSWGNLPRAAGCKPGLPCAYEVRVRSGVVVDAFRWDFGDPVGSTTETKQPAASHTFTVGGLYRVKVTATASDGETYVLQTSEGICVANLGGACDPSGACCVGSCEQRICR
ncbi:MAG TPA: PKD domain-containing protein [Labilithrix sp.]|nr:PKD domain-containing protein [Labilithrix sp.]